MRELDVLHQKQFSIETLVAQVAIMTLKLVFTIMVNLSQMCLKTSSQSENFRTLLTFKPINVNPRDMNIQFTDG